MRTTARRRFPIRSRIQLVCAVLTAAASLVACGKSVPEPTLSAELFEHRFVRSVPPEWATAMVMERHFRLKTRQMEGSIYAPVAFHSIEECQANLRNYSAYRAQAEVSGSGQTSVHAIAADQYTDMLPDAGPELVTLQCFGIASGAAPTPVPAPAFDEALKVADTRLTQSDLPAPPGASGGPGGAQQKPVTYLNPNEPFQAQGFDRAYNAANLIEPNPIVLGVAVYDVETRKLVKAGRTPYEFEDFRSCWGNIGNFMAYMTPHIKGMPNWPKRLGVYGGRQLGEQYIGREPQTRQVLLVIAGCVRKAEDGRFTEDPKHATARPDFDVAQNWVARGGVK